MSLCTTKQYSEFVIAFFKKENLPIDYSPLHDDDLKDEDLKYLIFNKIHNSYIWDTKWRRDKYWSNFMKEIKLFNEKFKCDIESYKKYKSEMKHCFEDSELGYCMLVWNPKLKTNKIICQCDCCKKE